MRTGHVFVLACCAALALLLSSSPVGAAMTTMPLTWWTVDENLNPVLVDSGWSVTYNTEVVQITVDAVSFQDDYVLIEISKDFLYPPHPITGRFPALIIDFIQRLDDASTVSSVRIADESITNLTGAPWTNFHWAVMNHGNAWFDVTASGAYGIQPEPHFQTQYWWLLDGTTDRADGLALLDGLVVDGSSYYPGLDDSDLVIQVDLADQNPMSFTLKEYPTPEPGTMALLGIGLGIMAVARKRGGAATV